MLTARIDQGKLKANQQSYRLTMKSKTTPTGPGAAIAGMPPMPKKPSSWERVKRLATPIIEAQKRGWQIEQIVAALNEEFAAMGEATIRNDTFSRYISTLNTQHRIGELHLETHTQLKQAALTDSKRKTQSQDTVQSLRNQRPHQLT